MSYYDEDREWLEQKLRQRDQQYEMGQDAVIELLEDVLASLKLQDFKLPTLKKQISNQEEPQNEFS